MIDTINTKWCNSKSHPIPNVHLTAKICVCVYRTWSTNRIQTSHYVVTYQTETKQKPAWDEDKQWTFEPSEVENPFSPFPQNPIQPPFWEAKANTDRCFLPAKPIFGPPIHNPCEEWEVWDFRTWSRQCEWFSSHTIYSDLENIISFLSKFLPHTIGVVHNLRYCR